MAKGTIGSYTCYIIVLKTKLLDLMAKGTLESTIDLMRLRAKACLDLASVSVRGWFMSVLD